MSQRVKRPNRLEDGTVPAKRRKRPTAEEEETAWQPRPLNDLKSIYNRSTTEAPAELFRKDLISAMKLPDSEPLANDEYWIIVDQWKQEWERGVQVPVNPDSLPEPSVTVKRCVGAPKPYLEFKLPKNKYIRITKDDQFNVDQHVLSNAPTQAEAACSYDLDECDVTWLKLLNGERAAAGLGPVSEDQFERVLERFELRCWDKIQAILRNEEGLGIEYDENVICDVCRSPDSEEGNEMVFCDSCNICVHQACYGITRIPEGQWLCCTCALLQKPECVLCPNKGGAMKSTRSGQKWAHVSCALWIPEVSIGCVEKMEPITKISSIPQSRWALICVLCRERVGACIQCSVKTCKTAYHVTCAFKHGLEMRAIIEDENADDGVKLRSYCEKHSKSSKKEKSVCSGSDDDDCKRKKRKDMTSEEKNQARAARLQEIEAEFHKHVSIKDIAVHIDMDSEALQYIYNYWKLKRKAGHNKPLLPPKSEDVDMLSHKQEQADIEKMKMFVQLRQDLERVRNLCYMVSRREKLSRTYFRMREQTFHKQAAVLRYGYNSLSPPIIDAVIEANHGPSIYDRLYSHDDAEEHSNDFESILARLAGLKSPKSENSSEKKTDLNGLFKDVKNNPYKKLYFNGSSKRRSESLYGSSMSGSSSCDERPKDNKENRMHQSSSEAESSKSKVGPTQRRPMNSKTADRRQKRMILASRKKVDSSSEDDVSVPKKEWEQLSRSRLKQVESELGKLSGSDSDELTAICTTSRHDRVKAISSIYSDSDSSESSTRNDDKSSNAASDSQQNKLRTKAAVKEFSNKPSTTKSPNKSSPEVKKKSKKHDEDQRDDSTSTKKGDYVPSDLIVPQRQAAKKASENLKNTTKLKESLPTEQTEVKNVPAIEEKVKSKKLKRDVKDIRKERKSPDIFDIDKEFEKADGLEILSYVPQRQAAKKAAEHIKSGLVKPGTAEVVADPEKAKKEMELVKPKKDVEPKNKKETEPIASPVRKTVAKRNSSSNSSSSSSSSSSSDSSSSSSSDSEVESNKPQSESLFSPSSRELAKRTGSKDWPFLDKAAKSPVPVSSSSSSESSRPSTPIKSTQTKPVKADSPKKQESTVRSAKPIRKGPDKKSPLPSEREEPSRPRARRESARGRSKPTNSSNRVRDANVRSGDLFDGKCGPLEGERAKRRDRKSIEVEEQNAKEMSLAGELQSPVRKTSERDSSPLKERIPDIANNHTNNRLKSPLGKSFTSPNAVTDKLDQKVQDPSSRYEPKSYPNEKLVNEGKSPDLSRSIELNQMEQNFNYSQSSHVHHDEPPELNFLQDSQLTTSLHTMYDMKKLELDIKISSLEDRGHVDEVEKKSMHQQNRSIFSPRPPSKDNDLLDIDNFLEDDFGNFKDEEVVKGHLTFSFATEPLFKEDSKEDSARETLNLVEKLRMEMSKKSSNSYDVDDSVSVTSSTKNDNERLEYAEQIVPNNIADTSQQDKLIPTKALSPVAEKLGLDDVQKQRGADCYVSQTELIDKNQDVTLPVDGKLLDDGVKTSDGRWITRDNYEDMQIEHLKPAMDGIPALPPTSYPSSEVTNHSSQNSSILPVEVQEDLHKSSSPTIHDQRVFMDPASIDCINSSSPYIDMHPQAKWAESKLMPNRRSSSSSITSMSSTCSKKNDTEEGILKQQEALIMNHAFNSLPPNLQTIPPNAFDSFPTYSDASQFVGPVSLFPPPNINTQLPFPSPSMFPPSFGAPFPTPQSLLPSLAKPEDTMHYPAACTATFTSSQHNMALTAAMVNLPAGTLVDEPSKEDIPPEPHLQIEPKSDVVAVVSNASAVVNHIEASPSPSVKSNSEIGKKSPSKPLRTSARVVSQQGKSPAKSPNKSPKQDLGKNTNKTKEKRVTTKSGPGRGSASHGKSRGKGRGRGRANHMQHIEYDYPGHNTIHNKLVGTVYDLDFDDDISSDNMADLKAMRERRKSSDTHDRKTDIVTKSASPKLTSPPANTHKKSYSDLKPPSPIPDMHSKVEMINSVLTTSQTFPDIVQPVLPGPVDMRTYNNFDPQTYSETNLLNAFSAGTADPQIHDDIDEDFEKELHSALKASLKKSEEQPTPEIANIKVSLSDSRNQLKVKIKGPIANYTSTVAPLPPATTDHSIPSNIGGSSATNNFIPSANINSGSSNLRRMRKKELLRQYWTQENMDEPSAVPGFSNAPAVPPRNIITIPKAVASMTTIPTKEDYRDYRSEADNIVEGKHKKENKNRPLSRELKQLDLSIDEDGINERRRSISNIGGITSAVLGSSSDPNQANKRRGRPPRPTQTTPKLKIKIGDNNDAKVDDRKDRIRPPKKRLSNIAMPSVEDLKRESMKYRKLVMAGFGEGREKKKKKEKGEKRKKKHLKQTLQIIPAEGTNTTKLIIRFGKKTGGEHENKRGNGESSGEPVGGKKDNQEDSKGAVDAVNKETVKGNASLPNAPSSKITPIKLKLSRCQEGSYIMKTNELEKSDGTNVNSASPTPPLINLLEPVHTPLPLNKDCEVR